MPLRQLYASASLGKCPVVEAVHHKKAITSQTLLWNVCTSVLDANGLKIVRYLRGLDDLCDLGINKENARDFLHSAKAVDMLCATLSQKYGARLIFQRSTYDLRTHILETCSPLMETTEPYTKTLDPKKTKNSDYLKNPSNWVPERLGFYAKYVLPHEYIRLRELSKRLHTKIPTVFVVRGNTASGKSSYLEEEFKSTSGCLNPDSSKYIIQTKTAKKPLTSIQVHREGTYGPIRLYKEEILRNYQGSIICDGRYSSYDDLEAVIQAAKNRKGCVHIVDFATPLLTSQIRSLVMRDPYGQQPCVPPQSITKAHIELSYRARVIERIKQEKTVTKYDLFDTDENGKRRLVAKKRDHVFTVLSQNALESCCRAPTIQEIDAQMHRIITPEFIEEAIQRHAIPEKYRKMLTQWQGVTLLQAAEKHALGIDLEHSVAQIKTETLAKNRYGTITLYPFCGSWLNDFPQVSDHLVSEQLLHVLGVDEDGRGLTWKEGTFERPLNHTFSPQSKVANSLKGGFQMKLGYFIVPKFKVDLFQAAHIPPKILKELEVKDEAGELLGYRFFVHPEAYLHFSPLHEAQIQYVTPEQSEYLGSPTSSYRSLAVRRVCKTGSTFIPQPDTVPFIVKLGVEGAFSDSSKLLPREEVEKSIQVQTHLDAMQKIPPAHGSALLIFPENLGIVLKGIPHYPSGCQTIDSGLIIREFPQELLDGKCKIFSASALMSVERIHKENQGVCALNPNNPDTRSLPLIYEIIDATIKKGVVTSAREFIQKYFIDGFLQAIESLHFQRGLSLPLHAQNISFVLSDKNIPLGFAIRDHGDINQELRFLETYTLYLDNVFTKLLNVLTATDSDVLTTPVGQKEGQPERNPHYYLRHKITDNGAAKTLKENSLTLDEYTALHQLLNERYISLLTRYFDVEKAAILQNGVLIAAQADSSERMQHNRNLWKYRLQRPRTVAVQDPIDDLTKGLQNLKISPP